MSHLFSFKKKVQDFVVDEQLPYSLTHEGKFLYIQIQKENKTTLEIVDFLVQKYKLPKKAIGFAGLKDKQGVTTQWLSIDATVTSKLLRTHKIEKLLSIGLSDICKVLSTGWYHQGLSTRDDLQNRFIITLRSNKSRLYTGERTVVEAVLSKIFTEGHVPNLFGEQRFGVYGRNSKQGLRIISGDDTLTTGFDRIFKIQAYASHLFNITAEKRIGLGNKLVDGDLVLIDNRVFLYSEEEDLFFEQTDWHKRSQFFVSAKFGNKTITRRSLQVSKKSFQIVLPVLGYNALIPNSTTVFGKWFHGFMKKHKVNQDDRQAFEQLKIFGIIRSVWVEIIQPSWKWYGDSIIMQFGLPAGSYASIVVSYFLDKLDKALQERSQGSAIDATPSHLLPQHKEKRKRKVHRKGTKIVK